MAKYLVKVKIEVDGVVEKHDIIGAIFGQTEGLFGEYFDLRTLQERGKIGRIAVNAKTQNDRTVGEVIIPSNLDRIETALLIAMIENIDRVGPYQCRVSLLDIVDVRLERVKKIVDRAVNILKAWSREKVPDIKEILKELQDRTRISEPILYGPENLPAGPGIDESDTIIVVEGRADVINMLQYGYNNVIALGGARKVPETLRELSTKKKVVVLVDGDHAADLVLKEVLRDMKVDYIARAPQDREVEELTSRELEEALSKAVDVVEYLNRLAEQGDKEANYLLSVQRKLHGIEVVEGRAERPVEVSEGEDVVKIPSKVLSDIKSLYGTLEALVYDEGWNLVNKLPVKDLASFLDSVEESKVYAIVFDGIVTQRILDKASSKRVKVVVGARIGRVNYKPPEIVALSFNDLF